MQYKIYINGDAYRPVKTDVAYRPLIYRAVSIVLTVKMPDGSVLESKQVEINGSNHMTNANGQITLTDDMGTSTTYRVKYSDIYYTDVDVTYTKDAMYDVKLEQHVAAGSVSVGVWNYYSSNFGKKSYTLTIPAVVKIIKITGTGFDGWSDESTDSAYVGTSGKPEESGNTVIQCGNGSFTKYVGVTAGKSYTLYGRWIKDAVIAWSDEINTHKADVTI